MQGTRQIALALASRRLGAVLAASLVLSGCYTATFTTPRAPSTEAHEVWLDGFLFGLVGGAPVDARFYCSTEPATVGVRESPLSWGTAVLTLGIYTPRVASITCASADARPANPVRVERAR